MSMKMSDQNVHLFQLKQSLWALLAAVQDLPEVDQAPEVVGTHLGTVTHLFRALVQAL